MRKATVIDQHVGWRLRRQRQLVGLKQIELAEELGITFQQIQKYEKGSNRISAGRLQQIANMLRVPIGYFFEEEQIGAAVGDPEPLKPEGFVEVAELLSTIEGVRLACAFLRADGLLRRRIVALVEAMVKADADKGGAVEQS